MYLFIYFIYFTFFTSGLRPWRNVSFRFFVILSFELFLYEFNCFTLNWVTGLIPQEPCKFVSVIGARICPPPKNKVQWPGHVTVGMWAGPARLFSHVRVRRVLLLLFLMCFLWFLFIYLFLFVFLFYFGAVMCFFCVCLYVCHVARICPLLFACVFLCQKECCAYCLHTYIRGN